MSTNKNKIVFTMIKYLLTKKCGAICKYLACSLILVYLASCKKLIEIPPPSNSITTSQVFADSADAAAAISGIYSKIQYGYPGLSFCNGAETVICGLSSDELISFYSDNYLEFYSNTLEPTENNLNFYFWQQPYNYIYQVNACIESLQGSSSLPQSVKNQFIGEAKFFRGLFYFYLINLFGDVPYVTSTNWKQTDTTARTDKLVIYEKIIGDLKSAQNLLRDDYSFSGGERTRVNKLVATAFLARVYLYLQDWKNAELQADTIINNDLFSLLPDLNSVFLANSNESILQWQLNTAYSPYNCTQEGLRILPSDSTLPPSYYVSSQLLNSFEPGDQREVMWLNQSNYNGSTYVYPYKYKMGQSQLMVNGNPTEYYTVLRLAEQYLIRAEARTEQGNVTGAASDLNTIRNRAGLANTTAVTEADLLTAISHERQVELFAEWGHRWLDLKRLGQVNAVMSIVTPQKNTGSIWQSYQQLYPIPSSQLSLNPFLIQNPGY